MASSWVADWAWGLSLLVVTVVAHVAAIVLTARMLGLTRSSHSCKAARSVICVALAALASALYLGLEAAAWAGLYLWISGSAPCQTGATRCFYSLGAVASYGHADIYLAERWRLLGAIEAVNGLILFGLTTAFPYAAIHEVWPLRRN